jgi:class 3 adenylate cyclase
VDVHLQRPLAVHDFAYLPAVLQNFDVVQHQLSLEVARALDGCGREVFQIRFNHASRQAIDGLNFRIGINSGPVVAGVIGHKKFQYDIWGPTVNTASRMESQGLPGQVQITQATYELLKDEFVCEPRGKVEVKGVGEVETWFLVGERERQGDWPVQRLA